MFEIDRASPAYRAGLREGDIISSVNRQATPNLQSFLQLVNQIPGELLLSVHRGNRAAYLVIP